MTNLAVLSFNNTNLDIVDRNGQQWMQSLQIAKALGYKQANAVTKIFNRNSDEFMPNMASFIDLPNMGKQRIFSLRGAHLLGMFARTEKAKEFRKWVLNVLDQAPQALQPAILSTLSPSSQRTVQEAVSTLAHDNKAYAKYYGALKTHFRVGTYKDIPNDQLEEALQVLQGVVIEQKAIESSAPALTNTRLLLSYDHQGNQTTTQVPNNACVMTMKEMLKHVNATNGAPLDTDDLADFAISTIQRMQQRSKYYETKAQ